MQLVLEKILKNNKIKIKKNIVQDTEKKLDQYYTKGGIADFCIEKTIKILKRFIHLEEYLFFEPSAGYGCLEVNIINRQLLTSLKIKIEKN